MNADSQTEILLTVCIPSLPERMASLAELVAVLRGQDCPELEVLVLMDNRRRHLGEKRNAMIRMARGKFIANVDDDDLVTGDYFAKLRDALREDVDVVGHDALCSLNGSPMFLVRTGLDFPNEQPRHRSEGGYHDIRRTFWHWCAWRRELALQCPFPEDCNDGAEDARFLEQALPRVRTWRKVDEALFIHRYWANRTTFG